MPPLRIHDRQYGRKLPHHSDLENGQEAYWILADVVARALLAGELHPGKGCELTALFAVHHPLPGIGAFVVDECRMEEACVRALKKECNFFALALGVADGLADQSPAAGVVEPQAGILARGLVPADEDDRFIRRLAFGILLARRLLDADVLVPQYPSNINIMSRRRPADGARKNPLADKMIEQGILECRRLLSRCWD